MQGLQEEFGLLGYFIALTLEHECTSYTANIYADAYSVYLRTNNNIVQEFNTALERSDVDTINAIIKNTVTKVSNSVKTYTIRVRNSHREVLEKRNQLKYNIDFNKKEETIQVIREMFACDEMDIRNFENIIENLNPPFCSFFDTGETYDGNIVLIFYLWRF